MSAASSKKIKEYRHGKVIQWLAGGPRASDAGIEAASSSSYCPIHKKRRRHRDRPARDRIDDKTYRNSTHNTSSHRHHKRDKPPIIHHPRRPISPPTPPPTISTPSSSSPTFSATSISSSIARMAPNDTRTERRHNNHNNLPGRPRPPPPLATTGRAASPDPPLEPMPLQSTMTWYEAGRELSKRGVNVTIDLSNLYTDPNAPEPPLLHPEIHRISSINLAPAPTNTNTNNNNNNPFTVPVEALHALIPLKAVIEFKPPQSIPVATSSSNPLPTSFSTVNGNGTSNDNPDNTMRNDVAPVTCHQCGDAFESEEERERHFERVETWCTLCKRSFECAGRMWGRGHGCAVATGRVREGGVGGGFGAGLFGGGWGNGEFNGLGGLNGLNGLSGFNGMNGLHAGWGFGQSTGAGFTGGVGGGSGREGGRARGSGDRDRERERERERARERERDREGERSDWE